MQTGLEYTYPWTLGGFAASRQVARERDDAAATLPPRGGHGPMITRMVVQTTLWLAAMGAILFCGRRLALATRLGFPWRAWALQLRGELLTVALRSGPSGIASDHAGVPRSATCVRVMLGLKIG